MMLLFSMYSFKFLISISFFTSTAIFFSLVCLVNLLFLLHHTIFSTSIWDQRDTHRERTTNLFSLWYRRLCPFDGCWLLKATYKGLHGLSFEHVLALILFLVKVQFLCHREMGACSFSCKKVPRREGEKLRREDGFGGIVADGRN